MKHPAVLMNISGEHRVVPLDDDVSIKTFIALLLHSYIVLYILFLMTHWPNNIGPFFIFQSDLNIVASYDRRGKHIYTGNAKGRVRQRTAGIMFSKKWQNDFLCSIFNSAEQWYIDCFVNYINFLLFISLEISMVQNTAKFQQKFWWCFIFYQYVIYFTSTYVIPVLIIFY